MGSAACPLTPNVLSLDEVATRDTCTGSRSRGIQPALVSIVRVRPSLHNSRECLCAVANLHFWLDNRSYPAKNTANSGKIAWPLGLSVAEARIYDSIHSRQTPQMSSR